MTTTVSRRVRMLSVVSLFASPAIVAAQVDDHLRCYEVRDAIKLKGLVDIDTAQFGLARDCKIGPAQLFCVPATKSVSVAEDTKAKRPIDPLSLLSSPAPGDRVCYKVKCKDAPPPDVEVTDQFGTRRIGKLKQNLLCTPAVKGAAYCGDGTCGQGEGCATCAADCGSCTPSCANGTCDAGEDCGTCPHDCGVCDGAVTCSDGACTFAGLGIPPSMVTAGREFELAQRQEIDTRNRSVLDAFEALRALGDAAGAPRPHLAVGQLQPTGLVLLRGDGFGDAAGRVILTVRPADGSIQTRDLEVDLARWTDDAVVARVPDDLTVVGEPGAQLEIAEADGTPLAAAIVDLKLKPLLAIRTLDWQDPAITVTACDPVAGFVSCNGSNDTTVDGDPGSIWGTKFALSLPPSAGIDAFDVQLLNGWTFFSATTMADSATGPTPSFPPLVSDWAPAFQWSVASDPLAFHFTWIQIVGPANLPHS